MPDLVVTVPRGLWLDWIDEGDAVGEPETGETWGFFLGWRKPPIEPGERLHVVAHDRLRGYAPVTAVEQIDGRWAIGRKGGAVAVTIDQRIEGFRGWRKVWWRRDAERPFPDWKTAGLWLNRAEKPLVMHFAADDAKFDVIREEKHAACGGWIPYLRTSANRDEVTCKRCLAKLGAAPAIVEPDDQQVALFGGSRGT
jgi:hypothetical protein